MTTWLTRKEAAAYVRLSESVFKRQIRSGRFPAGRPASSRRNLWRPEDLDAALGVASVSNQDRLATAIDELVG